MPVEAVNDGGPEYTARGFRHFMTGSARYSLGPVDGHQFAVGRVALTPASGHRVLIHKAVRPWFARVVRGDF